MFYRKFKVFSTCVCLFYWTVKKEPDAGWHTHTHVKSVMYHLYIPNNDCIGKRKYLKEWRNGEAFIHFHSSSVHSFPFEKHVSQPKLKKRIKFGFQKRNFGKINTYKYTLTKKHKTRDILYNNGTETVAKIRHHLQYFFDFSWKSISMWTDSSILENWCCGLGTRNMYELRIYAQTYSYTILFALCLCKHWTTFL